MAIDATLYSLSYIRRREEWRDGYSLMASVFANTFGVGSIVDVGCAGGLLVEALRDCGYEAWGIDGAPACAALWPEEKSAYYMLADLTNADEIDVPATDFMCSLEVAEHLPQSCAASYVTLLTRHRPKRILFTAAPTGQPGMGHINCQPFSYWIGLFTACGYQFDVYGSCRVREQLRAACDVAQSFILPTHYINNFFTFSLVDPIEEAEGEDVSEAAGLLRRELAYQRQLLDVLICKTAVTAQFIGTLKRHLGEPTELSEDEYRRLRTFTL